MEFMMKPIGIIHSPFTDKVQTPIQPTCSQAVGQVEVLPKFTQGLQGYVPDFDVQLDVKTGWYDKRSSE